MTAPLAAASFIALVPVIAVFVLLQRYFVAGLTAGAVKG
jgi:ABC-type glycerol-3-phosphate transport system permease component